MEPKWFSATNPISDAFICGSCKKQKYHCESQMFYLINNQSKILLINCDTCLSQISPEPTIHSIDNLSKSFAEPEISYWDYLWDLLKYYIPFF